MMILKKGDKIRLIKKIKTVAGNSDTDNIFEVVGVEGNIVSAKFEEDDGFSLTLNIPYDYVEEYFELVSQEEVKNSVEYYLNESIVDFAIFFETCVAVSICFSDDTVLSETVNLDYDIDYSKINIIISRVIEGILNKFFLQSDKKYKLSKEVFTILSFGNEPWYYQTMYDFKRNKFVVIPVEEDDEDGTTFGCGNCCNCEYGCN